MSAETLFNLGLDHWQAFLLSFIPALLTLGLFVHIYSKFPAYKMNRIYLLYLLSMFMYQINDSLVRLSKSEDTARSWDRLLGILWALIVPAGLHWALFLTGSRLASRLRFIAPLYFSLIFFAIPLIAGLYSQPFIYSTFWGWMRTYKNADTFLVISVLWFCLVYGIILYLFGEFVYKNRHSPDLKFVSIMNFVGYSIFVVVGISLQVIFPVFFNIAPIPIGSTLMITTTIAVIGLNSYKVFSLSETIDTEYITEIIQEIIFVVTPGRSINYMNAYAANFFKTSGDQHPTVATIFSYSADVLNSFEREVLIPSFSSTTPCNYQFLMDDADGKKVHWDVTTYQVRHRSSHVGLIVMCRDTSDRALLAEARLAALRSQMNPHFIFNSLNSIQYYIHRYKRKAAESFLSTFSILIRKILDNSSKFSIPLSDEINTIELYLQLEKLRFGKRLDYVVGVDSDIDQENILIPSMLIQPYIENAIIHGLAALSKGGKVTIHVTGATEAVICVIKDNGVGRTKSRELKSNAMVAKTSYGMSITDTRLGILNQKMKLPVSVKITDLLNEEGEAAGTQVEIYIPVNERF